MGERVPDGLYESLVESAGDIIGVINKQGTITFINSRFGHYQGATAVEAVGRHYSEFIHPEDMERFDEAVRQGFLGAPIADLEFRGVMPDGTIQQWVANATCIELDHQRVLMAICRDVTERVRLARELVARNEALAALGQVAVALTTCSNLDEGLAQALEQILFALGLKTGAIVLRDAGGNVRIGATSAPDLEALSARAVSSGKLPSLECMERGERIIVPDVFDSSVDALIQDLGSALGIEALVVSPLVCKENVQATLALGVPPPADMSAEQTEFLQLAAGILGPAIENAALHADLTDRVDRLAMLERLARSINSGRDVQAVLGACMREVAHLVPYDMAVVVLFRQGSEAEVFPFGKGGEPQSIRSMGLNHEQSEKIAHISGPTLIPDAETMMRYHTHPETFDMGAGSAGLVPLPRMGERFGLLKVWSSEPNRYGHREMEILAAAAEHLAIAASNATMYEREQQRSRELTALAMEVRHRIKNNLQMMSGLLEMSLRDPDCGVGAIHRCLRQVGAISTVHDMLSGTDIAADFELRECLQKIAENAVQATGRMDSIKVAVVGDDCTITSDAATAMGVMVNELVSNAVEHGFRGIERGRIEIRITPCVDRSCCVEVTDDGVGLPDDFALPEPTGSATGLGLVSSLARHGLGGKLEIEPRNGGVCARISVKGVCRGVQGTGG